MCLDMSVANTWGNDGKYIRCMSDAYFCFNKNVLRLRLTISIVICRRDRRCFLLRLQKMSQFSCCRSLKPTARWWFSNTEASLYIRASSESKEKANNKLWSWRVLKFVCLSQVCIWEKTKVPEAHTCVDEELVGHSWMVYVMNCTSKQSSHDLKICEHILKNKQRYTCF